MTVSKSVYEYFLANLCLTCHANFILAFNQIFTKMLQVREVVNSPFCGCCIIRDFVPINQNVSTGNVDTSNAAYMSQKNQNYLLLPFYLFNYSLLSFEKWQNVVSAISGYKISYIFLKVSQYARNIKLCQCITCTH